MRQNAHRLLAIGLTLLLLPSLSSRAADDTAPAGDSHTQTNDGASSTDSTSSSAPSSESSSQPGASQGRGPWHPGGGWGNRRRRPSNGERLAGELPKNLFDEKFREQFKNAVDTLATDPEPIPGDATDETKTVQDRLNEAPPANMATRLKESAATVVPETKAPVIVVEMPKLPVPQPPTGKTEEAKKESPNAQPQNAPNATGFGPTTTVIRAKTTSALSPNWGKPKQAGVLEELDLRRAERSFKEIDVYATSGPQKKPDLAGSAVGAPEKKPETAERETSREIIYVENRGRDTDEEDPRGRSAALLEANVDAAEGNWALRTQRSFEILRRKVRSTPWEGILVNVILLVSGMLLLALVAGKRRRLATSGYPPASALRARTFVPEEAVSIEHTMLLPSGERLEEVDEGITGSWSGPTGASVPLNDDIRVAFDPHVKRWVLKRREAGGMSAPLAELQPGTVVRGTALGAKSRSLRYKLSPTNTWLPTEESEQIIISVKADHFRAANG